MADGLNLFGQEEDEVSAGLAPETTESKPEEAAAKPEEKPAEKPKEQPKAETLPAEAKKVEVEVLPPVGPIKLKKTFEELVDYVKTEIKDTALKAARIPWELGAHVKELKEGSKYGDHSVEELAEALGQGYRASWLYETGKMFEVYDWERVAELAAMGISPTTIARVATISDPSMRKRIEMKIEAGEIKTVKEVNREKSLLQAAEDKAAEPVGDDEKTVAAAAKVRAIFGKIEGTAKTLTEDLQEAAVGIDELDNIADDAVNDSCVTRIGSVHEVLTDLKAEMVKACDLMKKVIV